VFYRCPGIITKNSWRSEPQQAIGRIPRCSFDSRLCAFCDRKDATFLEAPSFQEGDSSATSHYAKQFIMKKRLISVRNAEFQVIQSLKLNRAKRHQLNEKFVEGIESVKQAVRIPIAGAVNSLNVACAGSILLWDIYRNSRRSFS
jgi:hypothetical protein